MPPTRPDPAGDQLLLKRIAQGDALALGEFYDRFSSQAFGLVTGILRDRGEAEDVLQEVFVRVWERAGTYNPALGSPAAWLTGIARNRAIDRLRARAARPEFADCSCVETRVDADATGNPEVMAASSERRETVLSALSTLSPEQRRLIEHAYYLGYSQSELAAHFRMPLGTVKTKIRAGMTALRQQLQAASGPALRQG